MAITLDLAVDELAATRFAVSPLYETVAGLQLLAHPPVARLAAWRRWARTEVRSAGLLLPNTWPLLVHDRPSWPEFLVPSPAGPAPTIDDELARMQRTHAATVRASLARVFGDDLPPPAARLAAAPAAGLRTIAGELVAAHALLIAPHWDRLRAVLTADIAHRARQLAIGGAERLFGDLHPDLTWRAGRLTLRGFRSDRRVTPGAGGLVLVPSVLSGDQVKIKMSTSTQTALRYPARGSAALWSAGLREPGDASVRLLGRPRAALLAALQEPSTTGGLAAALGVTPSAVSQHLAVLRASGLVTSERSGRTVVHLISDLGRALLDP